AFALAEAGGGRRDQHRRAQVLDALQEQVDGDRHGDRAEEDSQQPADRQPEAGREPPGGPPPNGPLDPSLGSIAGRSPLRRQRPLHQAAARYWRISRRATQPASENSAAEKSSTAAIAKRVALEGLEPSESMFLTIVGASGREGS